MVKRGTKIGFVVTALWIAGVFAFAGRELNAEGNLKLSEWGDFFAGAFAPLAFLWLVLGYFQQGDELNQNTRALQQQYEEMKKSAEQAEIQARAIQANEQHARRDTFFRIAELYERDLNYNMGILLGALFGNAPGRGEWESVGNGNVFAIARNLQNNLRNIDNPRRKLLRTDITARAASRRFCLVFENILSEADKCKDEGIIRSQYEWSPFGEVYSVLSDLIEQLPKFQFRTNEAKPC